MLGLWACSRQFCRFLFGDQIYIFLKSSINDYFAKNLIDIDLNILAVFLARADMIGWFDDWSKLLFFDLDDDRCLEDDLDFLRLRASWFNSRFIVEYLADRLVLA